MPGRRAAPRPAPTRPAGAISASSALASVFRRRVKIAWTSAAKIAGVLGPAGPAGETAAARAADCTFGGGRNAPGGSVSSRVDVARVPDQDR